MCHLYIYTLQCIIKADIYNYISLYLKYTWKCECIQDDTLCAAHTSVKYTLKCECIQYDTFCIQLVVKCRQ